MPQPILEQTTQESTKMTTQNTEQTQETTNTIEITKASRGGFTQAWDTVGAGAKSLDGESLT
jgi:hypothetical protein